MTASLVGPGPIDKRFSRDREGHRTHVYKFLVYTDDYLDGPFIAGSAPGLPLVGSALFIGNDIDPWAFCLPDLEVVPKSSTSDKPEVEHYWIVTMTFSTRPLFRCQDQSIEDPLLEPDRISGSFVKYTKEVTKDKDGNFIQNSSHELIKGPLVEFDHNRPTVRIEQNVTALELDVFSPLIDTVNDSPLWGLPARTIKLSNVSWQRKLYGTCSYYYTRILDFDVDFNTFDRTALDEGTKVLHGHWEDTGWVLDDINGSPPDPDNPQHFDRFKDRKEENATTVLDGAGKPYDGSGTGVPGSIDISYYAQSNFLVLGIPVVLA